MTEIVWEEPPFRSAGSTAEQPEWAAALIANPGKWARVQKFDNPGRAGGVAQGIKSRSYLWAREISGKWDAATRTVNGEYWLYARYLGEPDGGAE